MSNNAIEYTTFWDDVNNKPKEKQKLTLSMAKKKIFGKKNKNENSEKNANDQPEENKKSILYKIKNKQIVVKHKHGSKSEHQPTEREKKFQEMLVKYKGNPQQSKQKAAKIDWDARIEKRKEKMNQMFKKKEYKYRVLPKAKNLKTSKEIEEKKKKEAEENLTFAPKIDKHSKDIMEKKNQDFNYRNETMVKEKREEIMKKHLNKMKEQNKEYKNYSYAPNCKPMKLYKELFAENKSILNDPYTLEFLQRTLGCRQRKQSNSIPETHSDSENNTPVKRMVNTSMPHISQKFMDDKMNEFREDLFNVSNIEKEEGDDSFFKE